MMHSVQVPDASPDRPGSARLVKLNAPLPDGNVCTGNAATVTPLCASVPRKIERNAWLPAMSSLATVASPVVATVSDVQADPLSTVGRFGLAAPDQCVVVVQLPTILIDHELSVPTSA